MRRFTMHLTSGSNRMKLVRTLGWLALLLGFSLDAQARKPNVLLICVDDLRPELACFGADYIKSPHIDQLAAAGRLFRHHYV